MTWRRVKEMVVGGILLFLFSPIQAIAGMGKILNIFDAILPPAILWITFVTVWYLAVATVASRHGASIGGVPPLPKAFIVLLWVVLLSLTMIGPMGIFYLLLFFPVVTVKAFLARRNSDLSEPLTTALQRISLVSSLLLAGLIAGSVYIHSHRTKADFHKMLNDPKASRYEERKDLA